MALPTCIAQKWPVASPHRTSNGGVYDRIWAGRGVTSTCGLKEPVFTKFSLGGGRRLLLILARGLYRAPVLAARDGPGGSCGLISVALAHKRRGPLGSGRLAALPRARECGEKAGLASEMAVLFRRLERFVVASLAQSKNVAAVGGG